MKVLPSCSSSLSTTPFLRLPCSIAAVSMVLVTMPFATAFTPDQTVTRSITPILPSRIISSQTSSLSYNNKRKRRTSSLALANRREDLEDRLWSIQNSWKSPESEDGEIVVRSDIPSSDNEGFDVVAKEFQERFLKLPPEPEDQFIMSGDIAILFLYAFSSHSINDKIVNGLLNDPLKTIPEAVKELDPTASMQAPVWVDLASNPNLPMGNPAVDHALEVSAREAFLNHWGALFSTEGSACVALCTCWLIAGWFHRAFMFDNSTYCRPDQVLLKTVETWLTSALLLAILATGTDWLVGHVPALQSVFCVTCKSAANAGMGEFKAAMMDDSSVAFPIVHFLSLTQSDILFIVDSLTILLSWRWSAHRLLNTFR